MAETHPYAPIFNNKTKVLIIGTSPPMRFTQKLELEPDDVNTFYGSRDNYFWDLLGDVFDVKFLRENTENAINHRKEFLVQHHIGLADIVSEFTRKDNDASDNNLIVTKFQDIYTILLENPSIQKIYFTGYSGPNSSESLTSRHLGEHNVFNTIISKDTPKHKSFKIDNRVIHSFSLYSPSPAARKKYSDILSQYMMLLYDK